MYPPTPSSTLYPYTTLFRSVVSAAQSLGRDSVVRSATTDAEVDTGFAALIKAGATALVVQNDPFFDSRRSQIIALSDRKSTRLNSSHPSISYAVFCLKKKNY